jgi:hypothetical protein
MGKLKMKKQYLSSRGVKRRSDLLGLIIARRLLLRQRIAMTQLLDIQVQGCYPSIPTFVQCTCEGLLQLARPTS